MAEQSIRGARIPLAVTIWSMTIDINFAILHLSNHRNMRCSGSGFGFAITPIQYKYKIARNQAIRRRQKLVIKPRSSRVVLDKQSQLVRSRPTGTLAIVRTADGVIVIVGFAIMSTP